MRYDLTHALGLSATPNVSFLTVAWCFNSDSFRVDGGQKRGIAPVARGGGWYEDLPAGTMARVSYTGKKWIVSACCCGLRAAFRNELELAHTGGCGRPMETCGKKSGTDPGSKMDELRVAGGDTGSELFPQTENCWNGYQRPVTLRVPARTHQLLSRRILSSLVSLCSLTG